MSRLSRLSGLFARLRGALAGSRSTRARASERRVRPMLEALEEKVLPSTISPAAKFNGVYQVSIVGKAPAEGGYFAIKSSYYVIVKNGIVSDYGPKGGGKISASGVFSDTANYRGVVIHLQGKVTVSHGHPVGDGTFGGTYLGHAANGTWHAVKVK